MKKSFGPKTLVYPTPVWCIGSYDKTDRPNITTVAWGGICCSKPPCVTVSLRKTRYAYDNIIQRRAYTVNVPSEKFVKEADYFGIVSGRDVDKFAATGLTPVKSELVDAPYVQEFPMVMECRLVNTFDMGAHTQFVGEIIDVKVDEGVLDEKGLPDIQKVSPLVYTPEVRNYYGIGTLIGEAYSIGKGIK